MHAPSSGSPKRFSLTAILVGLLGGGLFFASTGCEPWLVYWAEQITGVPLEGFPTATPTVTATPNFTQTISALPTPSPTQTSTAPPQVQFTTSLGSFVVELDNVAAPTTVANFLRYVEQGFYSNLIFHRSVQSGIFIVQGGGFTATGTEKGTYAAIPFEFTGLNNVRGTIAMARTSDPNSATSQFFINNQSNPTLNSSAGNPGYAVFGAVVSGQSTVDLIAAQPILDASSINAAFTEKPSPQSILTNSVTIISATRIR